MKAVSGVLWVTGMPGSGKSTLANAVRETMQDLGYQPILLDGDSLRDALNLRKPETYETNGREQIAMSYSRLCQLIANQGFLVICATVSMFHSVRAWNRQNLAGYFEVFVNTAPDRLYIRDQKGLYSSLQTQNILPEFPMNPDVTLKMHQKKDIPALANQVVSGWVGVLNR